MQERGGYVDGSVCSPAKSGSLKPGISHEHRLVDGSCGLLERFHGVESRL